MLRLAKIPASATIALIALAFAFRLFYGLSSPFWPEDERQVYLIGLQSFARGQWPYFGADVVWTGGQVPGALLGWLIRAPLELWPIPESPFVLLNILSFSALCGFAWYLGRRFTDVPRWLIWSVLFTLPWTLSFSTHIVNPSYVLTGAILFFVGFFEGFPAMRMRILPLGAAWALMGAGLFFVMQMHMSWVLLPPYIALAAAGVLLAPIDRLQMTRAQAVLRAGGGFLIGSAVTGSLLAPTLIKYGFGAGHVEGVVAWTIHGPMGLVTTAARVLSFASFETNRFLALTTAERGFVLLRTPAMLPFVVVMGAAGLAQPVWMAVTAFRRAPRDAAQWAHIRGLMAFTVILIYASYFFSVRGPQAHSFYVVSPVAVLFAASCWQMRAQAAGEAWRRRLERVAAIVIVSSVIVHSGLAIDRWSGASLYADRAVVAAAIDQRNDRFLGDRRDTAMEQVDHRPRPIDGVADVEAYLAENPEEMLEVVRAKWTRAMGDLSRFDVTIANRGRAAAWLDIRYRTKYTDATGREITSREGVIKRIIQPGATLADLDIGDDFVPDDATAALFRVVTAERCIPSRQR